MPFETSKDDPLYEITEELNRLRKGLSEAEEKIQALVTNDEEQLEKLRRGYDLFKRKK